LFERSSQGYALMTFASTDNREPSTDNREHTIAEAPGCRHAGDY
jgi:hypothetical protein